MTALSNRLGNSGAEEAFVKLFCETFGPEKGQFVYTQYPFTDIYGGHRSIDYALNTEQGRVAIEVDGEQWHHPGKVSQEKYHDDLLKQNSMVHEGWKVFRWTDSQIAQQSDRVKDELITFLGQSPNLTYIEDNMPLQNGKTFSLMEHQEEALENLQQMRENNETIALLYHATGTGKTTTAIMDAKAVGKRVLFLAHTRELVNQAAETFRRLWPEVSVGKFAEDERDTESFVICGSIQSVSRYIGLFKPDDFGYLIIDECHHGTAESYQKILGHLRPEFTLGLTATPERTDGEDLLKIFKNVAHRLDLQTAVELGTLVPVRCIRVKTNIDLHDVRINGFKYNSLDLESKVFVPERNQLIVNTWLEYVKDKSTVIFCTSVKHAAILREMFYEAGISVAAVSGSTNPKERKQILQDYEDGRITVLCACDLLNEGWDSPHTKVLFMARPTMSKTIYLQQLGRGMRLCEGKDHLMVFDFVDNANLFNCPYSLHRLLGLDTYRPGGLVMHQKSMIHWDEDMFRQGEKPEAIVDYPVHITDLEHVDLFNWQEKAQHMISQMELVRRVNIQSETIDKYIREGKIVPDMEVPVGEKKSFKYFEPEKVSQYCRDFGWTEITAANIKDMFMTMNRDMTMSYSYKPVFIQAFMDHMDEDGNVRLEDIVQQFADYYETRVKNGLPAEKKKCIFTRGGYSDKDVEKLILSMPFKRYEDMNFMRHARHLGVLQLNKNIVRRLTEKDKTEIRDICQEALKNYFAK